MERDQFTFYRSFWEALKVLPKKDQLPFVTAICTNYLLSALQAAKVSADGSFRQPVILEFRSNIEPILLRTNKEDIKMVLPVRIKED